KLLSGGLRKRTEGSRAQVRFGLFRRTASSLPSASPLSFRSPPRTLPVPLLLFRPRRSPEQSLAAGTPFRADIAESCAPPVPASRSCIGPPESIGLDRPHRSHRTSPAASAPLPQSAPRSASDSRSAPIATAAADPLDSAASPGLGPALETTHRLDSDHRSP